MSTYFIQKEGVYFQGVYWIGDSQITGRDLLKKWAQGDNDNYHGWVLYKYIEPTKYPDPWTEVQHEIITKRRKEDLSVTPNP